MSSNLDEFRTVFGDYVPPERPTRSNWHGLCVCGHLDRYHSTTVGGTYELPESTVVTIAGATVTRSFVFDGCVGALKKRSALDETMATDREAGTQIFTKVATCPCTDMRQVASVDRPNRFFCQGIPLDPADAMRHPFVSGFRAFTTHLSRRKAATADETWAEAELDRRFHWDETVRNCSISRCSATGGEVWPAFVNGDLLSELRCSAHRRP